MNYQDDIAIIGNVEARLAELLHQAMKPGGERLLFEAFWDTYAPLRHRAADELADIMSDELAIVVAHVATGELPPADAIDAAWLNVPGEITDEVRRTAALALRTDELPPEAQDCLLRAIHDDDESVRYHAFLALHRNAPEAMLRDVTRQGLVDLDPGVAVVACQIAAEYSWTELLAELRAVFDRLEGTDRFAVAVALSELVEPESAPEELVDVLLGGLRDEKTIAAACKALARLRPARAIAPLRKAMGSFFAHPLNKVEAAAALVALRDDEGAVYLEKMLDGRRKDTRGYAIELIARLGLEPYRERIEAIARSKDYHADTAVLALRSFGDSRAYELLRDIARTHPELDIRELAAQTSAVDGTLDE